MEIPAKRRHGRLPIAVGLGLILLWSTNWASAQTSPPPEERNWQSLCKAAIADPLPPHAARLAQNAQRDEDAQRDENTPRQCDEVGAYYGFKQAPNYPEALRCAYLQRARPRKAGLVDGPGTLAMLYANGYGVPRDYPLAIRFSCELGDQGAAPAETALRLARLEALRDGKLSPGKPFDLCDDATSGALGGYCQYIAEKLADVGRARRLEALRVRLSRQAQAELPRLEAAEAAFEKARGRGEYTGGGGSGSAGFALLDQGQLREQFVMNLQRFAAGDLPRASAADRARATEQVRLAAAAAQHFKPGPNAPPNEPTPQTLAEAQQAWRALFAAWMRFVPVAYPQLSPDAAATELLRLRIHQLRRIAP